MANIRMAIIPIIALIAQVLAGLRGIAVQELAEATTANAIAVLPGLTWPRAAAHRPLGT